MTNDEKLTEEMQKRMEQYEERLRSTFEAKSADLTTTLREIDLQSIIDPENEDPEFYDDFTRVIDDARVKHAEDDHPTEDTEVTSDPYVGI
jgi:hypothetical protein